MKHRLAWQLETTTHSIILGYCHIRHDAIRGLLDSKSSTQSAKEFGHNVNTLQYHRKRANKQLAQVYGCTA